MQEIPRKYSISTIIVTSLAIIIILVLAFLLYYYSLKNASSYGVSTVAEKNTNTKILNQTSSKNISTNVIIFTAPKSSSRSNEYPEKSGNCFASSISAPFRQDAFRCMVTNLIYDPCFTVAEKGFVYCQIGIDKSTGFLIKLTNALPAASAPVTTQDNWAWYLKLKDGTECAPFTGTRPFFSQTQIAYYGCKSKNNNEQVDLIGDLVKGDVWTAVEAVIVENGANYSVKSIQQVEIDTVWQ